MFHSQYAFIAFFVNVFENVFIVYLAGAGFFTAGVIANLIVSYFVINQIEGRDDIALVALYVLHIVQYFA